MPAAAIADGSDVTAAAAILERTSLRRRSVEEAVVGSRQARAPAIPSLPAS